ncbi:MAG: hypothetical protein CMD58_00155 [Gammaproteobacteria bacterium]|nr:hypothetical protein [Gammaproteobacteria bacterium]
MKYKTSKNEKSNRYGLDKTRIIIFLSLLILSVSLFIVDILPSVGSYKEHVQTKDVQIAKSKKKEKIALEPSNVPYAFEAFLNDFQITPDKSIYLFDNFPKEIFTIPGAGSGTSRQFELIGNEKVSCSTLLIEWASSSDKPNEISFDIIDRIGRPVLSSQGISGLEKVNLKSGIYRITLRYSGTLPSNSKFLMKSIPINKCPINTLGFNKKVTDVPTLNLNMPIISTMQFDFIRRHHENKLLKIETNNLKGKSIITSSSKVDGYLNINDSDSFNKVKIWSAGAGDIGHFNFNHPSMTIEVINGPLPFGMTKFKLYTIYTKEGLLDFVAGKLIEKEGGFVPHWKICWLNINGKDSGLYILEESPSENFFIAKKRHYADISSFGRKYFKAKGSLGRELEDYPFSLDYLTERLNKDSFIKSISLLSRLHATHGMENTELRMSYDPIAGEYEPMIRDINVNLWNARGVGVRSSLVHGSWWLSDSFYGIGSHQNVKEGYFGKKIECLDCHPYIMTERTVGFAGVNPAIKTFTENPSNKVQMEKNLLYYSSNDFYTWYQKSLKALIEELSPKLEKDHPNLHSFFLSQYKNPFDPLASNEQADSYGVKDSSVATIIKQLPSKGKAIIMREEKNEKFIIFSLYNFSLLSLDVSLPDGWLFKDSKNPETCSHKNMVKTLGPTKFYTQMINGLEEPLSNTTFSRLSYNNLKVLLNIEKRKFDPKYQIKNFNLGAPSYFEFCVPYEQANSVVKILKDGDYLKVAGFMPVDKKNILPAEAFSNDEKIKITLEKNIHNQKEVIFPINEEVIFQQGGQYQIDNGYILRYYIINRSGKEVNIPIGLLKNKIFKGRPLNSKEHIYSPGFYKVDAINATMISERGLFFSDEKIILKPTKMNSLKKSNGLWIDNLMSLAEGPAQEGDSIFSVVDLYISVLDKWSLKQKTGENVLNQDEMYKEDLALVVPPVSGHIDTLVKFSTPIGMKFRLDEPVFTAFRMHSTFKDQKSIRSAKQTFSGRVVRLEKDIYDELIIVGKNQKLIIEPGKIIRFGPKGGLLIKGVIDARGTKNNPIVLTAAEKDWIGISIINNLEPDKIHNLENIIFSKAIGGTHYGYVQMGGLSVARATVNIKDLLIKDIDAEDAINFYHSRINANGLNVKNTFSDALDSDWSFVQLKNSNFDNCGGDCIDLNNSFFKIENININQPSDKAFSLGESSTAELYNIRSTGGNIGIAIKDQSLLVGSDIELDDIKNAPIITYIKKPTFMYPEVVLNNTSYSGKPVTIKKEDPSEIIRKYD